MKEFIIAGNWKMFKTAAESAAFITELEQTIETGGPFPWDRIDVVVFPPFTALYPVKDRSGRIKTGAQNLHFETQGAFTGEISPLMLKDVVEFVLIGHSERRQVFHEADEDINKKIKTALAHGFTPVLCIGETDEEREAGNTFARIAEQLDHDLRDLTPDEVQKLVIAYEPIWAIGTGKTATPAQAQEVHAHIRKILRDWTGNPGNLRILYGGSVKPANSFDILSQNDINGVLVGGASLKVDSFFGIIGNSIKLVPKQED